MQADMRVLRTETRLPHRHRGRAAVRSSPPLHVQDRPRRRTGGRHRRLSDPVADRSCFRRDRARGPARPRACASANASSTATAFVAVATDQGIDLIVAARRGRDAELRPGARVPRLSAEAAEIVRVEAGRPRFGREMTNETIPQEAGINERAVSFTKGCYIGQETVARLHYKGKPNRHLRGLRLWAPVERGDQVRLGERALGHDRQRGHLPRPRPDRARDPAPGGRARRGRHRRRGGQRRGRRAPVLIGAGQAPRPSALTQ